jgi:excinuclease ABC subunit B
MRRAIDETSRRRQRQLEYNKKHNITPRGITKTLDEVRLSTAVADTRMVDGAGVVFDSSSTGEELAAALEAEMLREAKDLNFEKAASLRDRLEEVRLQLALEAEERPRRGGRGRKKR